MTITRVQVKAARALLKFSAHTLAGMADLSETTVLGVEAGRTRGSRPTFRKLQRALELNGVEFVAGLPGVRMKAAFPATGDEAALPDISDSATPYAGRPSDVAAVVDAGLALSARSE